VVRVIATARTLFRYGTWVVLVLVAGQFVLAGMGVFSLLGPNPDAKGASFLLFHAIYGPLAILVLSLLLAGLGFAGRLPRRMTALAAAFVPLLILQSLLLTPYHMAQDDPSLASLQFLSGLHVVNALVIFWLALEMPFWTRTELARLGLAHVAKAQAHVT
jgi:hypothetical protein